MAQHLGEFEQLIVFAILRLGDEAFGGELRREIERRTARSISSGALYTALERLEDRGFVRSRIGDATPARGGRPRKYFAVEPAGARALRRAYSGLLAISEGVEARLFRLAEEGEQ